MSIRERRPGVWEVQVYGQARPDGTRPRKFLTVHGGKRAAQRAERDLLGKRDAGRLETKSPTLKVYAVSWQREQALDLAASTADKHLWALRHILPTLGTYRLTHINSVALRDFKQALDESDLSGTSQRMVWDILSQVLKQAAGEGFIQANPCALVKAPQRDTEETEHLTKAQAKKLLKTLSVNPQAALAAWFMMCTAARPGEALSLEWSDLDLERGTASLVATKTAHQTRAGERIVPLPEKLVKALKRHRAAQKRLRLRAGDRWAGDLVFTSRLGAPWTVNAYRHAWRKAGGSDFCTPYSLRHTAITWWDQAGMRSALQSRLAGHSKQSTTMDIYGHIDAAELEDARRIVDALQR